MQKKIDIGKDAKVRIVWNVNQMDYSKEAERSIISKFASKYGISEKNISVERDITEGNSIEDLNSKNIKNINEPAFHQELCRDYITQKAYEDISVDEILKIDSQINASIKFDKFTSNSRYSVKWIKWSNILSYGKDNFFDFTKLRGIVNISGTPANQCGKTTFAYDIIHILLFGHTNPERAATNSDLFNYNPEFDTETEAYIEGCLNIDGCDYIIKRAYKRPAKSKKEIRTVTSKTYFYKVASDGNYEELDDYQAENLSEANTQKTNKVILDTIGNEKDFDLIISANGKDLEDLITLKTTDRGNLLTRWTGLSVIMEKEKEAKEAWKSLSSGRMCDIYNKASLQEEIDNSKKGIEDNEKAISALKKEMDTISKEVTSAENEKDALLKQIKPIDGEIRKLDKTTLENHIVNIIDKGKKKNNELSLKKGEIEKIGDTEEVDDNEYNSLISNITLLSKELGSVTSTINSLTRESDTLKKGEICPTCHRKLDNVDNSKLIAEAESKKEGAIKRKGEIEAEIKALDEKKSVLDVKKEKHKNKTKLQLALSSIEKEVSSLRDDYKEAKRKLDTLKGVEGDIAFNNEIDRKVNVLKAEIQTKSKISAEKSSEIKELEGDNKAYNELIKGNVDKIKRIDEELYTEKHWKLYLEMMGKNGISKVVLKNTIPIINGGLKNMLDGLCDFDVEISMNEKNEVEFWLVRNGKKARLSSASGFERTMAALALRVVLGNMSNLSRPPFIVLDEILGPIARENYDNLKGIYNRISEYYDFILHITHVELDWIDTAIRVSKNKGVSRIDSVVTI